MGAPYDTYQIINYEFIHEKNGSHRLIFQDELDGEQTYLLVSTESIRKPDHMEFVNVGRLKGSDMEADLIIITARDFLEAVEPLKIRRNTQGLRTEIVVVEDIFDEFSYGQIDPGAIRSFLTYAYENWIPPAPEYVLLFGDANLDFKDYLATGKISRVPAYLSLTQPLGLTPDDNWYACVQGNDFLPDMMIGRLPGQSSEDVAAVVEKIGRYEDSGSLSPRRVLLVADNNDILFEQINDNMIPFLPGNFSIKKVYLRRYTSMDQATEDIIDGINRGALVTNYMGHGAFTNWAGEFVFHSPDVLRLENPDRLTMAVTLNCLNGYFASPVQYSLAEEFLLPNDKGAIGCFSASGLGYPWEHRILDENFFSNLFLDGITGMGLLTTQAKIQAFARGARVETVTMFTLIGDPSMNLKSW